MKWQFFIKDSKLGVEEKKSFLFDRKKVCFHQFDSFFNAIKMRIVSWKRRQIPREQVASGESFLMELIFSLQRINFKNFDFRSSSRCIQNVYFLPFWEEKYRILKILELRSKFWSIWKRKNSSHLLWFWDKKLSLYGKFKKLLFKH